jgi:peptidoglycan/xylan/chitin deacetylase (PgdA/CDA1 family)
VALVAVVLAALGSVAAPRPAVAYGPETVYFPQTGHHLGDAFLRFWRSHGGVPIYGYPLTEPIERDGLMVQYFERARLELHPEFAGTPWEVEGQLLGALAVAGRTDPAFSPFPADTSPPSNPQQAFFPQTGHYVSNGFKAYWERNGGLPVFGYPLSEEFEENGSIVQYFERSRFEYHPEHAGTPHEVLLGLLGVAAVTRDGVDTAPVARLDGVPDYDPGLWNPPPPPQPPQPTSFRLPVLMYHRFGEPAEQYQVPYWRFAQQLDWLQANGYTTITLIQAYDAMAGYGTLPEKPVVITLDDGFVSQWDAAAELDARGMVGVFFVTTGQPHLADWQLADLAARGHEIGGHTVSHADLTTLSDDRLRADLAENRAELQAASGQPVDFFAYPYGSYDSRVIAAVQAAGYRGAVAAWGGQWWSPEKWWAEPRVEIAGWVSLEEFAELVR